MHETRDRWRNRATVKKNNKYRPSRPGGETIEKKDIGRKARSDRADERTKKKEREERYSCDNAIQSDHFRGRFSPRPTFDGL